MDRVIILGSVLGISIPVLVFAIIFSTQVWPSQMDVVDGMIEDWKTSESCDYLGEQYELVDRKILADITRPDMKEVLEIRLNELECEVNET